jgi:hypothetical protein
MEQTKLYCPPSGNQPQELPDYWRFENNAIRRDLREIDDAELNLWGWEGPFTPPIGKQKFEKTEEMSEEEIEAFSNNEDLIFDEDNNSWVSVTYDYDSETHKVVWYSKERKYIILPIDEDSTEYEIPYRSSAELGAPLPRAEVDNRKRFYTYRPEDQLPPPPPILWIKFKKYLIESVEFNQFVASLIETMPILAISLPAAIVKLDLGMYNDFRTIWDVLKANNAIPEELVEGLREVATDCRLPQDFFDVLGD